MGEDDEGHEAVAWIHQQLVFERCLDGLRVHDVMRRALDGIDFEGSADQERAAPAAPSLAPSA